MKVLFTDLDGVLKTVASMIYSNRMKLLGLSDIPSHESFCPISCSNLEYILEEIPDLQVVVSSNWRKDHNLNSLKNIFKENHLLAQRMIGTTPVSKDDYRGKEIEEYLKEHPEVTDFAIVDDGDDMKPYIDRLVQTDSRNGLTFSDAEKVVEMFGGTTNEDKIREEISKENKEDT